MTLVSTASENRGLGIACRIGTMVAFALMAAFAKLVADSGVPFPELIFFRGLFALIPILAFMALTRDFGLMKTSRPRAHLIRSAVGGTGMIFVFLGIVHLPLNEATAIGFSMPIVATLLSALFLKEHVGRHRWGAILFGFAGIIVLLRPNPDQIVAIGAVYALIGVCFSATVTITIRQLAATESPVTIAFYFMLLSAIAFSLTLPFVWKTPSPSQLSYLVGLGITGGIAQVMMGVSLRHAPVSTLMPFDYSQIIWTIIISWLLWGELPGATMLLGAAIVIASGLYIVYRERQRQGPAQPVASAIEES